MSSDFGKKVKITIFGQSHSEAIGVVIDGLPVGEEIDMEEERRMFFPWIIILKNLLLL